MKKKSIPNRNFRVADQIQRDLAQIIAKELKDSRLSWVTIMSVDVTNDLAYAKVYFSVLKGQGSEIQDTLNQAAGHIRSLLFKRLHIHTVPKLTFVYDTMVDEAARLDNLINQALSQKVKD